MTKTDEVTEVIEPTIVEDSEEISDEQVNELLQAMQLESGPSEVWEPSTLVYYGPESRNILLAADIDTQEAISIISQIKQLEAEANDEPIFIVINCHGGSIHDALSIYDAIRGASCPVVTIVEGNCASAAGLIHSAGDVRLCNKHAVFFYHQPIITEMTVDSPVSIDAATQHYRWSKETLDELQRTQYGITKKAWKKEFGDSTSKYFYAPEALRLGVVHAIIPYKQKPELKLEEVLEFFFS